MAKKKPLTEIKLGELQEQYLATRDEKVWQEMFSIMIQYARSLVLKATKGKVFLDPDHVIGVATDAAIKIMRRYHDDPDFLIDRSFGGLLRWKVVESLYGDRQEESHLSLNHIVSEEGGHVTELGDLQASIGFHTSTNVDSDEPILDGILLQEMYTVVREVLDEFDLAVDNYRLSLLARLFVLLSIRKSKIRHSVNIFKRHIHLRPKEEEAIDLLMLEIRNRLVITA